MANNNMSAVTELLDTLMPMINQGNDEIDAINARVMQLVTATEQLKPGQPAKGVKDIEDVEDSAPYAPEVAASGVGKPAQKERAPKSKLKRLTQEEINYQKRIQSLAEQLATGEGREQDDTNAIVAKLGEEAELAYLRVRVDTLTKMVNDINADASAAASREREAKEELAVLKAERNRLYKTVKEMTTTSDKMKAQLEATREQLREEQAAKVALQDEVDKAERAVRAGKTVVGTKDKDLLRALESIDKYKAQIKDSLGREASLREELEKIRSSQGAENKKASREKEELLLIVKKQQQLIDVLQRQKLHLQGALHLGLTEVQFNKILEVQ